MPTETYGISLAAPADAAAWSPRLAASALGGVALAVGVLVLVGWAAEIAVLKSVVPGWVAMQPLAAAALTLSGTALVVGLAGHRRLELAAAAGAALTGGVALAESLAGRELFNADHLLFAEAVARQDLSHPGRMAEITAVELLLFTACLGLARWPRGAPLGMGVASAGLLLAVTGVIGYLFDAHQLAQIGSYAAHAVHTGGTFAVLFLGFLIAHGERNWLRELTSRHAGGAVARRLAPLVIGLPLLVGLAVGRLGAAYDAQPAFRMALTVVAVMAGLLACTLWIARTLNAADRKAEMAGRAVSRLREQAAAAAALSEERSLQFQALADNIPQLAWMARPDGWIFWYNRRWYDYTGATPAEMQGWGWRSVHHPDHVERMVARIQQSWDSGEPWEDIFPLRGRDGGYRWFLSRAQPVRDEAGRVVLWFGTNTDITEQRAQETALARAKEEAERANRAKSQFLAAASHDLRQPVQALLLFGTTLRQRLGAHPAGQLVDCMQSSLDALQMLLEALLDISRLDAGVIAARPQAVALGELVARIAAEYRPHAEARGLTLRSVGCRGMVESDPLLLERILRNLLDNAIRYTERGGVVVGCRRRGGEVLLQVVDTGIGIAADQQEAVFHEFYQVGNPERDRAKGLGLGLSIIRRLTRLLGHRLTLTSEPGKGSCFSLHLPAAADAPAAAPVEAAEPARPDGGLAMIIDDEPAIRLGLAMLMEEWGWEVATAADAEEATAWLAANRRCPEVILADYRLRRRRCGTEAVRQVEAACGQPIPAAIITGDTSPERLAEITASGFAVAHKPITADTLKRLIARIRPGIAA